jgi:hypothetical protein
MYKKIAISWFRTNKEFRSKILNHTKLNITWYRAFLKELKIS